MRETPRNRFDLQNIGEKLTQLKRLDSDASVTRIVMQQFFVMFANHRGTASRRADDVLVILKNRDELFCQRDRVIDAPGIGHRLTTTGLGCGKIDFTAESFENLQCGEGHFGVKLVDVAGNKETDLRHGVLRKKAY